jgi:hypothetical protein
MVRAGLRIADSLGQHLTKFSLRFGRFPRTRFLPVCHALYIGMRAANATVRFEAVRFDRGISFPAKASHAPLGSLILPDVHSSQLECPEVASP